MARRPERPSPWHAHELLSRAALATPCPSCPGGCVHLTARFSLPAVADAPASLGGPEGGSPGSQESVNRMLTAVSKTLTNDATCGAGGGACRRPAGGPAAADNVPRDVRQRCGGLGGACLHVPPGKHQTPSFCASATVCKVCVKQPARLRCKGLSGGPCALCLTSRGAAPAAGLGLALPAPGGVEGVIGCRLLAAH